MEDEERFRMGNMGRTSNSLTWLFFTWNDFEGTRSNITWSPTRCVRQDRWFQTFFIFTPKLGEDFHPFWLAHIFQMGLFNHQRDQRSLGSFKGPTTQLRLSDLSGTSKTLVKNGESMDHEKHSFTDIETNIFSLMRMIYITNSLTWSIF